MSPAVCKLLAIKQIWHYVAANSTQTPQVCHPILPAPYFTHVFWQAKNEWLKNDTLFLISDKTVTIQFPSASLSLLCHCSPVMAVANENILHGAVHTSTHIQAPLQVCDLTHSQV